MFDEPVEEPVVQDGPDLFGGVDDDDRPAPPATPAAEVGTDTVAEAPVQELAPPPSRQEPGPRRPESPAAPLALYRRYRPDTFSEVIGQEHVTVPLQRALDNNKVNHAYLFSGPRGCGKTTSARILARCLNCETGPTSNPCGTCRSCVDLARGGPGSIDVIEIDAASHGGVDDARDLRERAFFAPVHSRYKIYIVDEAHMVTTAGFNALLKLVEEPPPHAKFVFATTEPEKVIGTIRSRTHHYPFRLVPPKVLGDYLEQICTTEGVPVDHKALPLVVRAGGGSVRDSLSVLDQLLGGAGEDGVAYEQAAALLGFTPDALLDEIMDAFAAGDSAGVFRTIDKIVEIGQDPRRFAEDLLRRLRDLVILAAVPEAATNGMLDVADDQAQRLATQVAGMGSGELTRAAEVIATGLTEMRGTTAPRLHLELMCARVLLPGADADERGLHARMDRLERRVGMLGSAQDAPPANWADVPSAEATAQAAPQHAASATRAPAPEPAPPAPQASAPTAPRQEQRPAGTRPTVPEPAPAESRPAQQDVGAQEPPAAQEPPRADPAATGHPLRQRPAGQPPAGSASAADAPVAAAPRPQATRPNDGLTAAEVRRLWPDVLAEVKGRRRFTYMMLSQHAQVVDAAEGTLVLGFSNNGAKENFGTSGSIDVLADSLIEVIGVEFRITTVLAGGEAQQEDQRPAQRPAGQMPASPEPQAAERASSAPSAPEPEPYPDAEPDDVSLADADETAAGLLTQAFGAQVIEVSESER
ncbi:DNA polymerase III subunit gamma and tau [Tessaracoccus rhinocerotis]|uniref:DNA polymerase III subunit gamma/tau n=1 Tax=Tessaracoccus rhinocerotis TaxID=1689449 RepID=A0A553JWF9_9ACTN|nr:DNA polymerase III subunit gamma and tau [Tessaracoccus rhinocerotis]TRY16786.1 DNA polymerase III subunit gamma and tau [Tessaracoccus rhinocerotis]